jgi:hypothetical protein
MKLSQAIRIGATKRPQAFKHFFYQETFNDPICSCALGAAYEGFGNKPEPVIEAFKVWQAIDKALGEDSLHYYISSPCPKGCSHYRSGWPIGSLVSHLNDDHHMSRETIADWLETLEL